MNPETFVANDQAAQAAADKVIVTFAVTPGSKRAKAVKPAPFINEREVRKFLLEYAYFFFLHIELETSPLHFSFPQSADYALQNGLKKNLSLKSQLIYNCDDH